MKARKTRRLLYELLILLLTLALLAVLLFQAGCWLMPERTTFGAVWSSYLQEPENSVDLLILGSSRAYCDVIPALIYQRTGVSAYCMCGPSQTASLTYYYLRECLRSQHPKCVLVEASGLYYDKNEEHSKTNVCYMPGSINRIRAAAACEEGILELALYPLQEFHCRFFTGGWRNGTGEEGLMLCGYTPLAEAQPQAERSYRIPDVQPRNENYLYNLDYFRKLAELCEQEGIRCVFFLSPTMQDYTDEQTRCLLEDLGALPCEAVKDWTDLIGEIGIDNERDWYDAIHFNQSGAEKFTAYLSDYLQTLGLTPTPGADAALWQRRLEYLH